MLILTLRTDKPDAEIGLYEHAQELSYETWYAHRQLSLVIHQKIEKVIEQQGKTLHDLRGIVIYQGPGSFTGLRIGISVANALAYGLDIPIAGTTGSEWQAEGIRQLRTVGPQQILPFYGNLPHITQQRK